MMLIRYAMPLIRHTMLYAADVAAMMLPLMFAAIRFAIDFRCRHAIMP